MYKPKKMKVREVFENLKLVASSDLDIIASEPKIQGLFQEAALTGKAPGNSCKIQILGDERRGKTSLRKKLMGEQFDPNEPPTFGIDTHMCKVNNVDESWRERNGTDSEYDRIMSWLLADRLKKWQSETPLTTTSKLLNAVLVTVSLILIVGIILLCEVLTSIITAPTVCYSLVILSLISVVVTKKSDIYRVGAGLSVYILLIDVLFEQLDAHTKNSTLPMILWLLSGVLYGIVCGVGLRTGVVAGILLLKSPVPEAEHTHWQENTSFTTKTTVSAGIAVGIALALANQSIIPSNLKISFICHSCVVVPKWLLNCWVLPIILSVLSIGTSTRYATILYGVFLGFGTLSGLLLGRWIGNNYCRKELIVYGLFIGILSGYVSGYNIAFIHKDGLGIFGFITRIFPFAFAEIYRRLLIQANPAPVRMVSNKLAKNMNTLPVKLSLWDFAGQEFYYNTHHTFMAPDAVYVIVFNLQNFKQFKLRNIERIKYWMKSIYQHADSSVVLVGTHLDCVDHQDVVATNKCLMSTLISHRYSYIQKLVFNGMSPFFAIDNSGTLSISSDKTDDTANLRNIIHEETHKCRPMKQEYPIRWRHFLDLVQGNNISSSSNNQSRSSPATLGDPFISFSDLQKILGEFGVCSNEDISEMLKFFHDSGEILYDSVDSILRQFVVLQPQLLIDIMQSIVTLSKPSELGPLAWAAERLNKTGLLEYELAKVLITRVVPSAADANLSIILGMLEAKDLICKVIHQKSHQKRPKDKYTTEVYVVPSLLPLGQPLPLAEVQWNVYYYVDFGAVLPDAVLFRLMARCASHSNFECHGTDQCMLFRNGGLFTLGTQFFFMLRNIQTCPDRFIIEVPVKAVPESNPLDVLWYISNILETLRCRDFPRLCYNVRIRCPTSAPHQGCGTTDMWHIIRLSGDGHHPVPEEPTIHRLCYGRQVDISTDKPVPASNKTNEEAIIVNIEGDNNFVIAAGRNARVSVQRGIATSFINNKGTSSDTIHQDLTVIDVYISSSPRDEGWVQENLVRFLSSPPYEFIVYTNFYDTPSHQNHVLNVPQIEVCYLFLAVCDEHYIRDPSKRLRYEREVARRSKVPLIAITKNGASKPKDMFDSEEVSFSVHGHETSLDLLMSKILTILKL